MFEFPFKNMNKIKYKVFDRDENYQQTVSGNINIIICNININKMLIRIVILLLILLEVYIIISYTLKIWPFNFKKLSCNYDIDCNNNCCTNGRCEKCDSIGPVENNMNDPVIVSFINYLRKKMKIALSKYVKNGGGASSTTPLDENSIFGLGIYIKNTPFNKGVVKTWVSHEGNTETSISTDNKQEPSFYFGSGTKPLTTIMVISQLYKLWRKNNSTNSVKDFIIWYTGNSDQPGAPPALTYGELFKITNGFENSNFTETITRGSNTQEPGTGESIKQTIKEWLFCCKNNGLIKNCSSTGIFCDDTCEKLCPISLNKKEYGGKCQSPFCPASICDWVWFTDYKKTDYNLKDPGSIPFQKYEYCDCKVIQPSEYQNIFQNLSIFDVTMMRSGIPDSDSIWGIDTSSQLDSRTSSIGPVQFVSEIIGFDWNPLWKKNTQENFNYRFRPKTNSIGIQNVNNTVNNLYIPVTKSLENNIKSGKPSNFPVAQYSSSAYTFLGILLWLLYFNKNKDDWSKINLNQLLPRKIRKNINFAGTEGNNGNKYFDTDSLGNKYYSFEKTVTLGNVVHPGIVDGTPIDIVQTDMTGVKAPTYKRILPDGKTYNFVDWDASSGLSCGNGWGKCSEMAEIYMNIISPNADNPIIGDKELQREFTNNFIDYNGSNWKKLWNNKIRPPWCLGASAWSQNLTYNCGVMGPDWFYIYDNPNSNTDYGIIPCYGHLGSTYGFNSGHLYFPGGTIKAYPPYLEGENWSSNYSKKDWSLTFDFCGGNEFTISQAHNNSNDDQSGAIQYLITELINDPFDWKK